MTNLHDSFMCGGPPQYQNCTYWFFYFQLFHKRSMCFPHRFYLGGLPRYINERKKYIWWPILAIFILNFFLIRPRDQRCPWLINYWTISAPVDVWEIPIFFFIKLFMVTMLHYMLMLQPPLSCIQNLALWSYFITYT